MRRCQTACKQPCRKKAISGNLIICLGNPSRTTELIFSVKGLPPPYPPPPYPLSGKSFPQKNLSGNGGYHPPFYPPLSRFCSLKGLKMTFMYQIWLKMDLKGHIIDKTLPKAQRTRGLSSYHKITVHISQIFNILQFQNLD